MALRPLQDIHGFYKGANTPSIETYPLRLPRILSPTDLRSYQYGIIDASQEIRLLELLPPTRNVGKHSEDIIKCRLHTHGFSHTPEFEALSYTWGAIERHLPLSITWNDANGQNHEEALFATPQLMMALRRLRNPTQSRWLWVDQLCINQDDDVEKLQQIQLMGQIYQAAKSVVIWLGEDHEYWLDDTPGYVKAATGQLIERTLQEMTENYQGEIERFNLARSLFDVHFTWQVNTVRRRRTAAVKEVLQRPWFTRAWVFQEASLARQLRIQYGATELLFDDFKALCDVVASVERDVGVYRDTGLHRETAGFEMMELIQRCRVQRHDQHQFSGYISLLERLLPILRRVRCHDPRDRIFAFLAFQRDEGISAIEGTHKSVAEVWTDAASRMIQASQSLDIFAAVSGDKSGNVKLPSWVPDWANCFPYGRPIAAPGITSFCASRGLPHIWTPHNDSGKLRVKGKVIDEVFGNSVYYQGPTLSFGDFMSYKHETRFFLSWDCRLQDLRRYYYRDPPIERAYGHHLSTKFESAESDLMRICLADGALAADQPLRDKVCDLLDLNAQAGTAHNLRNEKSRSVMTAAERQLVDSYEAFENMCLIAEHKQLFATVHFQLGLAAEGLEVGDKVAILHGSRTPCILRTVNEATGEYKVISQCYLDGWMFGEPWIKIPQPHPHQRWWEEEQDEFALV